MPWPSPHNLWFYNELSAVISQKPWSEGSFAGFRERYEYFG